MVISTIGKVCGKKNRMLINYIQATSRRPSHSGMLHLKPRCYFLGLQRKASSCPQCRLEYSVITIHRECQVRCMMSPVIYLGEEFVFHIEANLAMILLSNLDASVSFICLNQMTIVSTAVGKNPLEEME